MFEYIRQIFRFLFVEIDSFSFLNKISESLCHRTDQLFFLFKIKHDIVEGAKYSIKNTTNLTILFIVDVIMHSTESFWWIP